MKKTTTHILLCVSFLLFFGNIKAEEQTQTYTNDLPAYVIYNAKGEKVTFTEMIQGLAEYDICLFGEKHDNPIAHWLEKMVTEEMVKLKGKQLILGGEMWEADQQLLMDEFMLDQYVDKKTYVETAKNWPNFQDYKPLLGIAFRNKLKFVCTNIPRRYAKVVYKKGIEYLDSLNADAYQYLPPRPIHFDLTQPAYANMLSLFKPDDKHHGAGKKKSYGKANPMMKFKGSNLVKAQAIKDATMAYNIAKFWEPGKYFLHYNGTYHSKDYDSLFYYLKHYKPEAKVVTIHTWENKNPLKLSQQENAAHFNIMIPSSMPSTYQD